MASSFLVFCLIYYQVAHSQYYSISAPNYPSYSYKYYSPATPPSPSCAPTQPKHPRPSPPNDSKRSLSTKQACPKCSPATASAYFLSVPSEKVKAPVLLQEKIKETSIPPPIYSCPLCNSFADVQPNPKIPPPPPVGSPVLPGILDEIPTIGRDLAKDLSTKDPSMILSTRKMPIFSDMYDKHKLPKNLSFDQELLEGFLTGLGIAL